MTRWDIKKLNDYVRLNYSEHESIVKIVNSVGRYTGIFQVHLDGARDTMKGVVGESKEPNPDSLKYILGASDDQQEFMLAKVTTDAHFLGIMHATRSIFDVFAFLLNKLILNSVLSERDCDLKKVTNKLPDSSIKSELIEMINSKPFHYIEGFVNTSKHRYLIDQPYMLDIPENRVGIRITSFQYQKELYPARWIEDALEIAIEVKNRVVICGVLLNKQLLK